MPSPPRSPSHPPSDSESDLDLDLEELDPSTSNYPTVSSSGYRSVVGGDHRAHSTSPSHQPAGSNKPKESGPGIALLSLMGGARRKYSRLGAAHNDGDDDRGGFLGLGPGQSSGEGARRDSGEGHHHDHEQEEAPLLNRPSRSPSRSSRSSRQNSPSPATRAPAKPEASKSARIIPLAPGAIKASKYPSNIVSNHKFTPFTFLPLTLYHEFSFFFNLYFLLVALSQIIPPLRIGYLSSYIVPLIFVLMITLGKEALDDLARRRRDSEANSEGYEVLVSTTASYDGGRGRKKKAIQARTLEDEEEQAESAHNLRTLIKKSRDIRVGDILVLKKDQRVPADVIILKSIPNDPSDDATGEAFIRTDQLDGETDWKLRVSPSLTQALPATLTAFSALTITASAPSREVNAFVGKITINSDEPESSSEASRSQPLTIDNTAWANTVLASSSTTLAAVIFTGPETRQALSTSKARSKTGLLEDEINNLTKILCFITFTLSILLVALQRIEAPTPEPGASGEEQDIIASAWYIKIMRFLILFSSIIPISLRVNLDMGKSVYARFIERDSGIEGTVVRTSTIPEELGRVEYLLSDKTGTLTQNDMELKKVHVGTVSYAGEAMDEVAEYVRQGFSNAHGATSSDAFEQAALVTPASTTKQTNTAATRTRREIGSRVRDVVLALSLCHNVTPTTTSSIDDPTVIETAYQASSPDEIAIVRWTESVGLRLVHRDRKSIKLQSVATGKIVVRVKILEVFPFTSEGKRMGIVVQFESGSDATERDLLAGDVDSSSGGDIWFYQKGADTVMTTIVSANDWLDEECGNMAREGLRTLVVGRKPLSPQKYQEFSDRYRAASLLLHNRDAEMQQVIGGYLERDLELLGVTGVEDKLQRDVKPSLELLRNAGIKIWMLTGDKVETARCVAVSAKLVARGQYIHTIAKLKHKDLAYDNIEFLRNKPDSALLIDGESLALYLDKLRDEFISIAVQLPAVIACRCTPTQKADIARLIRAYTKKRICCIGDGGNDVSMIQAADVGVGIVGKEGRQASLAADFSVTQFAHLTKLLVWHGRNSYKRSAKLAQFVIHRGLIISVCQTMFSIASRFEPIALYQGWLLVGYATLYTMAPVFSLVLDKDVDEKLANLYPELYKELTEGRSLSYRTFFVWLLVSVYQGSVIQGLSQLLVGLANFKRMVSVSFTVLVLNELIMVALEITTWHIYMTLTLLSTGLLFFASLPLLGEYFDLKYVITLEFLWRVLAIVCVSVGPPWVVKVVGRRWRPPSWDKVRGV
ncbi:P-type ATPase-like protein [Peziza echinospora]|nr:P-type ATPase-like protein [Peziza echinospora]